MKGGIVAASSGVFGRAVGRIGLFLFEAFLMVASADERTFLQSSDPSGLLVFEAEHFATNIAGEVHTWTLYQDGTASGGNAMRALPDVGTNLNSGYLASSPHLDFRAQFTHTGTHYIWARCFPRSGTDDSLHVALDGMEVATSDRMSFTSAYGTWIWSNDTIDELPATINIPTTGLHTIQIFMREDGATVDKLLLTRDNSFLPSGIGPPESPIQDGATVNTNRSVPLLNEFIASCPYFSPGDIPEDSFQPPTESVYVAPAVSGGNDNNPGTLQAPFEHIEKAIAYANGLHRPLTISIRGGTYFYKTDSATETQQINASDLYLRSYPGESVTIRPRTWQSPGYPTNEYSQFAFEIVGPSSNVTVDGFVFEGWQILFSVGSDTKHSPIRNVALKNIECHDLRRRDQAPGNLRGFLETRNHKDHPDYFPFYQPGTSEYQIQNLFIAHVNISGTDLCLNIGDEVNGNVKGLRVTDFHLNNPPFGSDSTEQDSFAVVRSYKVLIDDCTIEGGAGDGIDLKSWSTCVANCLVSNTGGNGIKAWNDDFQLLNSILYNCCHINDAALVVKTGPARLINSMIVTRPTNGFSSTFGYEVPPEQVRSLEIKNSVFYHLPGSFYVFKTPFTTVNSLYYDTGDNLLTGFQNIANITDINKLAGCSSNISVNPMLIDINSGNFAPSASSALIDAGTADDPYLPSFDYCGRPRIVGKAPDIGPIESSNEPSDADGDGLPDDYETANGFNPNDPADANLDPDGDGFSNLDEFHARTDPHNSQSALRITGTTNEASGFKLQFLSTSGRTYSLDANDTFSTGTWRTLESNLNGNGNVVEAADTTSPGFPARTYRIKTSDGAVISELAGFYRLPLAGNSDTIISMPFTRPAAGFAVVLNVSGNVVQVQGAPLWNANQWTYLSGVQSNTYYMLVRSGAAEGESYTVTANDENSLILDLQGGSLAGLSVGDAVAVVPYWTLGTIFPRGQGVNASPAPGSRLTEILLPDISGTGINLSATRTYYFWNGAWRQVGQGGTIRNDDVILPDMYFWLRHNTANSTELVTQGSVLSSKWRINLRRNQTGKQDNTVALPRALTFTLDASGVIQSGAFQPSPTPGNRVDELLTFDNVVIGKNKSAAATYYYWNGAWRKVGSGNADVGADRVFSPGTGLILRLGPGSPASNLWINDRGY
jgi:uncharacterized protein (TIGR02597 family)